MFLRDIPLFHGTSSGLASVQGNPFPWPQENLHPGGLNFDGSPVEPKKVYSITTFHNFYKENTNIMRNYCSIALYPEEIKWVALESRKGKDGAPDACRSSYTARAKRTRRGRQEDAFCSSYAASSGCLTTSEPHLPSSRVSNMQSGGRLHSSGRAAACVRAEVGLGAGTPSLSAPPSMCPQTSTAPSERSPSTSTRYVTFALIKSTTPCGG